jgi:hypothetical protein
VGLTAQERVPDSNRLALPRPPNLDSQYRPVRVSCQVKITKSRELFSCMSISCGAVPSVLCRVFFALLCIGEVVEKAQPAVIPSAARNLSCFEKPRTREIPHYVDSVRNLLCIFERVLNFYSPYLCNTSFDSFFSRFLPLFRLLYFHSPLPSSLASCPEEPVLASYFVPISIVLSYFPKYDFRAIP